MCYALGRAFKIVLTSWDNLNCGGYVYVKLENPDGSHCETSERSLTAGDTLVWPNQTHIASSSRYYESSVAQSVMRFCERECHLYLANAKQGFSIAVHVV